MKMDSVMSSRTCRRNSALAQASAADSILDGFSSQDCPPRADASRMRWMVGKMAVERNSVQTERM